MIIYFSRRQSTLYGLWLLVLFLSHSFCSVITCQEIHFVFFQYGSPMITFTGELQSLCHSVQVICHHLVWCMHHSHNQIHNMPSQLVWWLQLCWLLVSFPVSCSHSFSHNLSKCHFNLMTTFESQSLFNDFFKSEEIRNENNIVELLINFKSINKNKISRARSLIFIDVNKMAQKLQSKMLKS